MAATAAKLLVYYNPDSATADQQERLVGDVADGMPPPRPGAIPRAHHVPSRSVGNVADRRGSAAHRHRHRAAIDRDRRRYPEGRVPVRRVGRRRDPLGRRLRRARRGLADALGPPVRRRRRPDVRAPGRGRVPGRCERRACGPVGLGGGEPSIRDGPATLPGDRSDRQASATRVDGRGSRPTVAPIGCRSCGTWPWAPTGIATIRRPSDALQGPAPFRSPRSPGSSTRTSSSPERMSSPRSARSSGSSSGSRSRSAAHRRSPPAARRVWVSRSHSSASSATTRSAGGCSMRWRRVAST